MTKRPLLPVLAIVAAVSCGGCSLMKKSDKPKENPSIAGETEDSLRQRWVDRRTAELTAQGVAAETARTQAAEEFRAKYPYMGAKLK